VLDTCLDIYNLVQLGLLGIMVRLNVQKQRTASEPSGNFGNIVKCLFQIIQCIHHGAIFRKQAKGALTKAFRSKLSDLDRFIRPAQTTSALTMEINKINKQWTHNISETLSNHYEERLKALQIQLQTLKVQANILEQANSVALKWARKNFRSKLQPETLLAFESLLCTFRQQKSPTDNSSKHSCTAQDSHSTQSSPVSTAAPAVISSPLPSVSTDIPAPSPTVSKPPSQTVPSRSYAAIISSHNSSPTQISGKAIKFRGAHDPLSNFFPFDLEINGVIWLSVEHRYQYDKAIFFDQLELAEDFQ
jgi:hypothetical protein